MRALITVFGSSNSGGSARIKVPLPHLTLQEKAGAILLIATSFVIGIYPRLVLDVIAPSFQSPLLKPILDQGSTL